MRQQFTIRGLVLACLLIANGMLAIADEGDLLWSEQLQIEGSEYGYSILQTDDNAFLIAGVACSSVYNHNIVLSKISEWGDSLWYKTYDFGSYEGAIAIVETADNNYALAGWRRVPPDDNLNACLMKVDQLGNLIWFRDYGTPEDDYALDMINTEDGGFLVVGACNNSESGANKGQLWILKTNAEGDSLWSRIYPGTPYSEANSVIAAFDSGYMIAGFLVVDDLFVAPWLLHIDQNGDTLWTKSYIGDYEIAKCIISSSDGNYILAGDGLGNFRLFLMKVDQSGDTIWVSNCGGLHYHDAGCVIEPSSGGYLLAIQGELDLLRTDSAGNPVWEMSYDDSALCYAHSLIERSDGNYAISGSRRPQIGGGNIDLWSASIQGQQSAIQPLPTFCPLVFSIMEAYPNPFNATISIQFELPIPGNVVLRLTDAGGRMIGLRSIEYLPKGIHRIDHDCSDLSSGIYVVNLEMNDWAVSKKIVLAK